MCLGALVDCGVPLEYLKEQLRCLGLEEEYHLAAEKVVRRGQIATKVHVNLREHSHSSHDHPPERHWGEIATIIKNAQLPQPVTAWSLDIFARLAEAEGMVHGIAPEKVHFHEVGATDALVDIVGTCLGLYWLGVERVYCSALPTGSGTVKAAHGRLPVPVPAVVQLWASRQVPIYSNEITGELVTPTGAAIAVTLAKEFGKMPDMRLEKIGLGAGTKDFSIPNILRLWLGTITSNNVGNLESVVILETQIDDLSPQVIAYTFDLLFEAGAVDVFSQPITMKKSRLGTLLTVICPLDKAEQCEGIIFRETTTLGIRRRIQERSILFREIKFVDLKYGKVGVKIAREKADGEVLKVQPEYQDCAQIALESGLTWQEVHRLALNAWYKGG
jgi:uncharacterized protein (TIGR00299 family) protein